MDDFKARYTPRELRVLTPECQMTAARFSPCGRFLLAAGYDARIHRWETAALDVPAVEEGQPQPKPESVPQPPALAPLTGHAAWVTTLAFSPEGERLYSGDSWGRLCCWNYGDENAKPLWQHEAAHDGWLREMVVSPDGTLLATCGIDRRIRLWSARDGVLTRDLPLQDEDVYALRFHPDGRSLISGDLKGTVRQWDVGSGEAVRAFDAGVLFKLDRLQDVGGARVLRFSNDGSALAIAGTTPRNGATIQGVPTVLLLDWESGERRQVLELGGPGDVYVTDLEFHPAGFLMITTSGNPGQGKFLFQRPGETEPFYATTHMANCQSLAMHPQGGRIVVAATNRNSNGNGRPKGEYRGNHSPIHVFEWAAG